MKQKLFVWHIALSNPIWSNTIRTASFALMFLVLVDPSRLSRDFPFEEEVCQLINFVKSSRLSTPEGEILMPGEIEERTRSRRIERGIYVDDATWNSITETGRSVGLNTANWTGDLDQQVR